jgi:hypothetical protein
MKRFHLKIVSKVISKNVKIGFAGFEMDDLAPVQFK